MIGKGGEALEETYTDDIMLPPPDRSAGGAEGQRALARPQPAGRLVRGARRRSARHLRLHGLRAAGTGADPVRQAQARPRHASGGWHQKAFGSTAAARRAGIAFVPESRRAMLFHQEPVYKNISISILDRISSLLLKPARERAIADAAGRAVADQAGRRRARARHAVRRQPAEGGAGEMAELSAAAAGALRADPRHGCRRQERRHQHRPRPARQGAWPSSCSRPNRRRCCRLPTASSC